MEESNRRIVILGSGAGKSSLANTIFGEKLFQVGHTPNSETRKCKAKTKSVSGRSITLIDTPGFFDTDRSEEEMKREIVRCITECAPGPHAFLIMLKVEKFTEQEQAVINKINEYFSEEAFKYATVVFTHGDQLPEGQTIEDFVHQNEKENKLFSDLMKKCGGRCHVIDNKYWNQNPNHEYRSNQLQVEELLKTIDKMVMENSCYTNKNLQAVEEEIKQEEEKIRHQRSSGNMSVKQIREQAKVNASTNLWVRLAGVGTGALLGALYGGAEVTRSGHSALAVVFSAAVGGMLGGVRGYNAAEGADTPWEAIKTAAGTECVSTGLRCGLKLFQPKS